MTTSNDTLTGGAPADLKSLPTKSAIAEVNSLQADIDQQQMAMVMKAIAAGKLLIQMKALIVAHPQRNWMDWCRDNIQISRSNINNYMLVARKEHLLEDYQRAGNGSIRGFLKFTREPEPDAGVPISDIESARGTPLSEEEKKKVERKRAERAAKRAAAEEERAYQSTVAQLDKILNDYGSDFVQRAVESRGAPQEEANLKSKGNTADAVFTKLVKKDQDILNKHIEQLVDQCREKFKKELDAERNRLSKIGKEYRDKRSELDKREKLVWSPLTYDEYKKILGLIHPDKHPGREDRANEAFIAFKKLEHLCKKTVAKAKARKAA